LAQVDVGQLRGSGSHRPAVGRLREAARSRLLARGADCRVSGIKRR